MAPMGIRLSPLGIGVFCLLGLGVLYHVYSGFLTGKFSAFLLGDRAEDPGPGEDTVDLRELLAVSVRAAELGGLEVKKVRESNSLNEKAKGKTMEGADDKMTSGDVLSNKKMYHLIKNAFPALKVNTEEKVEADDEDAVSWDRNIPDDIKEQIKTKHVASESITMWIDPLDATQEYTENLVNYVTTMVCVAVNGKPVIGVIHKPFTGFTAWAMLDGGSSIKKRNSYNEKTPTFIVSRSHSGEVKEVTRQTFGNKTEIISAGGAGYKVLSLLDVTDDKQETADVYIHVTYIKKWDICAGNAILNALGGQMTTLKGEEIMYTGSELNKGGLLASIGMDHGVLVEKLAEKLQVNAKKPAK
ncbi:inositol monophosphatase 3 [Xenopus tropicalis]|uniref:inositol monophosphatase 3 n=1 Tax=Xenopus tropicalis TaxID=8364 RepID=UPI0000DBE448|eukprot:NP_001016215.2 inositol monophosphatase 3 [Xenopus tropicalis]